MMKRSEMIEHIKEELEEFIDDHERSTSKRVPYLIKNKADGLLAMLEGFGMLPPLNEDNYHYMDNSDRVDSNRIKQLYSWEENEWEEEDE